MVHITVDEPSGHHSATVIFLHGLGGTGIAVRSWIVECFDVVGDKQGFKFNHIKVIYPTIPHKGMLPDRSALDRGVPETKYATNNILETLSDIIKAEACNGIPLGRIIVGGFSNGGLLSFHLGYRKHQDLAGIFIMSTFLYDDSVVYQAIKDYKKIKTDADVVLPELFMVQGTNDQLVSFNRSRNTYENMRAAGVKSQFIVSDHGHEIRSAELLLLKIWVLKKFPDELISRF